MEYEARPEELKLIGKAITNYKMVNNLISTKITYTISDGQTILLPMGHKIISFDLR
jgi:lipopolysaccharide export system protein LptA